METIKNMKKSEFLNILKQKIQEKSFEKLEKKKKSHTKVEHVEHNGIIMQKYLQPNKTYITKEESQLIFRLRCRMTEAKVNLKGKYDNLECGACHLEEETQYHILECKEINKYRNNEEVRYEK